MIIFENIFFLFLNTLSIYIVIRFLNLFVQKSGKNKKLEYIIYLSYWSVNSICYLYFDNPTINITTSVLGILLISLILYQGSVWKRMIAALSALAILMVIEDLLWLLLHNIWCGYMGEVRIYVLAIITFFIVEIIIRKFFVRGKRARLSQSNYLLMLWMPVGSIILTFTIFEEMKQNEVMAMVGMLTVLAMNFFTFFLYDKIFEANNEKWEKQILEEKILMYENQFEILQQSRKKMRALRHDINNHLYLLGEFEKNGQESERISYLETMKKSIVVAEEIVETGNEQVDAILNYLLEKAQKIGADIDVKMNIPQTAFCSAFDLNILLSNLLNNAIEAMEVCTDKRLKVVMTLDRGVLYLEIKNSFDGKVNKAGNRYLTRKNNADGHGIGLDNVQEIVDKYGGTCQMIPDEKMFCVKVILFVNNFSF